MRPTPGWWLTVERACTLLQLVYSLMRDMDRDGRMGMQMWSLGITLEKRMNILPMDCETRTIVMTKVKECVRMMALPVHAAAWMLHPLHRSPRLFDDLESEEIMNTLAHFVAVYTKNPKEYKECWREYDPKEVKRRAADWSKSRGCRSKSTKFDIRELEEEREDDGAWLLDLSCRPRRLADHDRGKTVVDVDDEEPDHDNKDDDELARVELVDRRSTRRSGGGSSSSSPRDHITMPEEGIRSRRRTSILSGAALVQGTASLSGAQLTRHRPPMLEEAGTTHGTTPGGSPHVPHDALEADAYVGADMDGPIRVAPMEADAVADARGDDPVGEHGDDPAGATATDGVVGAVDDGAVGADTGIDDGPIASCDVFFTPDLELRLEESFASLLPHVAPIAPRGSAQDFCKHLASTSPMQTDDESYTPD
ncbi:hypothetical protein CBR_g54027 [Chara braunii]|uniref:Uncharacterized protein n=1 Tax=Chara braunii TaxID=69332 RepID=A0A388MBT8_CHABU|nr:hypothetical protein CBR_g54027 [Chara braunii]|eukprot:GBG91932.1 hypothetical protein CBR_g54027 [Chara braunii]